MTRNATSSWHETPEAVNAAFRDAWQDHVELEISFKLTGPFIAGYRNSNNPGANERAYYCEEKRRSSCGGWGRACGLQVRNCPPGMYSRSFSALTNANARQLRLFNTWTMASPQAVAMSQTGDKWRKYQ